MTDGGIPVEQGHGMPFSQQKEAFRWVQQDIRTVQLDIRPLSETYYQIALQGTAQTLHDSYRKKYNRREDSREYFLDDWRNVDARDAKEIKKDKNLREYVRENPNTKQYEINLPQFRYFDLPPSLQEAYKKQADSALQLVHQAISSGMEINDQMLDTLASRLYQQDTTTDSSKSHIVFTDSRFSEEERERYRELIVSSIQGYVGATYKRHTDHESHNETAYEHSYFEVFKVRERLMNRYYLPTEAEVRYAFNFKPPFDSPTSEGSPITTDFMEFLKEQNKGMIGIGGTSEYPTREYIDGLRAHLDASMSKLGSPPKKITILEVGANDGRLAHFLEEAFAEKNKSWPFKDFVNIVAIDKYPIKRPDLKPMFDVKEMDYKDALEQFQPQIVIGSWIPSNKGADPMAKIGEIPEDWTIAMRATSSVQEYLLIGDPEEHGMPEAFDQDPITRKRKRKESFLYRRSDKPAFERDGFKMTELSDLAPHQFSYRDTDTEHKSRTYSFTRTT